MASHGIIKDTGAYFVIDPVTRSVTVPKAHRVIGTEGEHLSEQIIFECPQIIDGHDISQCERRYVAWLNTEGTPGHDELRLDRVENDNVYLSWDIRQGLTVQKGVVQFSIHFEDTNGSSLAYRFVTTTCKSCEILESVNATLGAYKAMWVVDDTLVLEDFTPVEHGALDLETAMTPEGTIKITEKGVYDVAQYARAEVDTTAGWLAIISNGTHDVEKYESVEVKVEGGVANGVLTNRSSHTITAEYTTRLKENPYQGWDSNRVELEPGGSVDIADLVIFKCLTFFRQVERDVYGTPALMPTREGLALGAVTGCAEYLPGGTPSVNGYVLMAGGAFTCEIIDA